MGIDKIDQGLKLLQGLSSVLRLRMGGGARRDGRFNQVYTRVCDLTGVNAALVDSVSGLLEISIAWDHPTSRKNT